MMSSLVLETNDLKQSLEVLRAKGVGHELIGHNGAQEVSWGHGRTCDCLSAICCTTTKVSNTFSGSSSSSSS